MLYKNYYRVISEAQGAFSDYVYDIALKLENQKQITRDDWRRVLLLWIKFHQAVTWRQANTDTQLNKCLADIEELSNINNFPFLPVPSQITFPSIVDGTPEVVAGPPGVNGTDANIVVEVDPLVTPLSDFQLSIREEIVAGVKTYYQSLVKYVPPSLSLTAYVAGDSSKTVNEVGDSVAIYLNRIANVNTPEFPLLTKVYTAPSSNPDITGITTDNFLTTAIRKDGPATVTFSAQITDGKPTTVNASANIIWRYPILYGSSASDTQDVYWLNKAKSGSNLLSYGNMIIPFTGTNKYYYYIAYPSTYPDLTAIFDGYPIGDNVLNAFQKSDNVPVTSVGRNQNWTTNYKVYRTIKTTIINKNYYINF
jgi:hypothetical protein